MPEFTRRSLHPASNDRLRGVCYTYATLKVTFFLFVCLVGWLLVGSCCLLVGSCCLLVGSCWLVVVGCWLLVVGCWLLVVGCCCFRPVDGWESSCQLIDFGRMLASIPCRGLQCRNSGGWDFGYRWDHLLLSCFSCNSILDA